MTAAVGRIADLGARRLYEAAQRLRPILVLTIKAPQVRDDLQVIGPFAADDVLLRVANVGSSPIVLAWGGVAWVPNHPAGLPVDEGSIDRRHKSPRFCRQEILPNHSAEFLLTSTYRLNSNLAWVGVEAVLPNGQYQLFKVPGRKLRRLVTGFERYRKRMVRLQS